MSVIIHEREQGEEDIERYSKRPKIEDERNEEPAIPKVNEEHILPPSHSLLGIPLPVLKPGQALNFREPDVGISEYIGRGEAKVEGIIKQRFTDFLVYEVDLDGNVIHLKSLAKPQSSAPDTSTSTVEPEVSETQDVVMADVSASAKASSSAMKESTSREPDLSKEPEEPWPERFDEALAIFLDLERVQQLKKIYLEGREPPRVSDAGWDGRKSVSKGGEVTSDEAKVAEVPTPDSSSPSARGGHGKRGGRGGGHGGRSGGRAQDTRKVVSAPIASKDTRTAFHKTVRELFAGKLETETDASSTDDGSCIAIKWVQRGGGNRGGRGGDSGVRAPRGTFPSYIHFTLQKTNRDTQDALGHLSRLLHVSTKDLSVAGTKDKRGVTVQRVSLLRNKKTVEEVWKLSSNPGSRRTADEITSQRGERGVRIADFNYRKAGLELGFLKGNAFVITLRSVKVESMEILDETMNVLKDKGFINYYGMQRFGTASVPTHSIGLALLKSEWQKAADFILQKRHGEHPDVEAARDAWLVDRDLDKALNLFPRRVVAERCILESFKKQKGDTRNVMGALSTIPKNLRLMYIHAYQSYVWNAIVSERIRVYGADHPVVGDLVFEKEEEEKKTQEVTDEGSLTEDPAKSSPRRSRKPYSPARVRTLVEAELDKYTIFDVIMPLPGTDVAYPGGKLGERYKEFLRLDGLDPDNWVRKQREYTLSGSYRKILHLPKDLSWTVLRYTDPDVPLAQADEDKLLNFDPPAIVEEGKFMALQINLTLGTAAYATMALREITKTDTSSHVQSSMTLKAEDQQYRSGAAEDAVGDGEAPPR
ncbi:pseudouridine synthase [Crepidotus variabilis]|uniref:Pseudouridine synthase n=1 Tax=Crepidotus variabilis TaxID=179855 RepID=A0A9P6ES90_9AGAR|nr:pseudouridine synthase [Crepidotus variabilis]